jgi:hypothetical protein
MPIKRESEMKAVGGLSVLAVLLALGALEAAAAECKVGSQQTLSGLMSEAVDGDDGHWITISVDAQPCSVSMLKGRGKVPAGCGFGEYFGKKRFTATGVVQDGAVLMVTSIRCS